MFSRKSRQKKCGKEIDLEFYDLCGKCNARVGNHGYEPQGKPWTQIPPQSSGVFTLRLPLDLQSRKIDLVPLQKKEWGELTRLLGLRPLRRISPHSFIWLRRTS